MLEEAEEIGRRARRARLRLGMTQADLAAALGRTQGWVSKMERGHIELDRVGRPRIGDGEALELAGREGGGAVARAAGEVLGAEGLAIGADVGASRFGAPYAADDR